MGMDPQTWAMLASGDPSLAGFGLADIADPSMWTPAPSAGKTKSPETSQRENMGLSEGAWRNMHQPAQQGRSGGGGGQSGSSMGGKALWQQLVDAGARPDIIGKALQGNFSHGFMTDIPDMRDAFMQDDYKGGGMGPMGGGHSTGGASAGSMGMAQPEVDPYWTGSEMRKRHETRQFAREDAQFEDQRKLKMLKAIMGHLNIGGMGGGQTTTEDTQQIVNNAGSWEPRNLHSTRTVSADPNQRLQLLSQLLGQLS